MMRSALAIATLLLSTSAFAVPGAKRHNIGTIRPKQQATAGAEKTASLSDSYALVGTISCESCESPFQPVAVIRELAGQKLLHLRVGDELALSGGDRVVVSLIGSGAVEFKSSTTAYRLRAGGFPDEVIDDSPMLAKTPKTFPQSYVPPPAPNGARW